MNFTFTWILDKFGFQPKVEVAETPIAKTTTTVAKKKPAVAFIAGTAVASASGTTFTFK